MTQESDTAPKAQRIVVVGNGFGGTYTLKNLRKIYAGRNKRNVHITILGSESYFLFTPLLHEVATGGIQPNNIIEPISSSLNGCFDKLLVGVVSKVNLKEKNVEFNNKQSGAVEKIPYDYLVLAPGSTTNYYSMTEAAQYCLELKTLDDAKKIKNRCISQMEVASHESNEEKRKSKLTFVIAGGGPTGVELAAELYEFLKDSFPGHYKPAITRDISVILVQKGQELIPQFYHKLRLKALQVLRKKGVEVMMATGVEKVTDSYIEMDTGTTIMTENVIWVAGVKPAQIAFDEDVAKLPDGRIIVDQYLHLANHTEVFVIGDTAASRMKDEGGKATYVPGLAQATIKEARVVARNIELSIDNKKPIEFVYRSAGSLVSLGHAMAMGEVGGFAFYGTITWWIWRTVYLSKVISWKKKLTIAWEWTWNLFEPRDIHPL